MRVWVPRVYGFGFRFWDFGFGFGGLGFGVESSGLGVEGLGLGALGLGTCGETIAVVDAVAVDGPGIGFRVSFFPLILLLFSSKIS